MAAALPWAGPVPTPPYLPSDFSPRPTSVPILPRDSTYPSNVCGWVNGLGNSPILCPQDQSCVWDRTNSVVGCCPSGGCSAIATGCVDSRAPAHAAFNANIMTCAGSAQCYQNIYPGGYTQYNCGSATWAANVQTTFSAQPTGVHLAISWTGVVPTSSSTPSSSANPDTASSSSKPTATSVSSTTSTISQSSSSISSSTIQTSSASSSRTASSTSTSNASSASSAFQTSTAAVPPAMGDGTSNIGVIIGGVLGAAALSLLVAALCWWLLRRRRYQRARQLSFDVNAKNYYGDGIGRSTTTVDEIEQFGLFNGSHRMYADQNTGNDDVAEDNHPNQLPTVTPPAEQRSYPFTPDDIISPISSTRNASDTAYAMQSAVSWPVQPPSSETDSETDPELIKSELSLASPHTIPRKPTIPRKSSARVRRSDLSRSLLPDPETPALPTREVSGASSRYSQDSGTGQSARARDSQIKESSKTDIKVPRIKKAPSRKQPDTVTGFGLGVGMPRPSRAQLRDIDALAAMAVRVPSPVRLPSYKPRRVDGVPIVRVPVPKTREERANSGGRVYVPSL